METYKTFTQYLTELALVTPAPTDRSSLLDVSAGQAQTALYEDIAAMLSPLPGFADAYVQRSESPIPPVSPTIGHLWLMTPDNHVAMYSSSGWLPIYPPTDNAAVEAGNAFLGVEGLWLAVDGD